MDNLQIRTGTIADLEAISQIEEASFPPAEMASKDRIKERLTAYGDRFWILENNGVIIAFINGMVSDERNLLDEMFSNVKMHTPDGAWQMIFSVATDPNHRKKGYAKRLLEHAIEQVKREGKSGLVLTCKDYLLPMYSGVGFVDEGVCDSNHGGAVWHQMRLTF